MIPDCLNCNFCGLDFRETVNFSADTRKCDASAIIFFYQNQRIQVTILQELMFIVVSTLPDWTGCMNDIFCVKLKSRSNPCFSGMAAMELPACLQ